MNFKNRLVKEKKEKKVYTWASTAETEKILKVSAAKLYEYRKKVKRNQLIEGVHYKRDEHRLCDRGSPLLYNLEKTCKRIHFLDFEIFTDPNFKRTDHFYTVSKEVDKYYPCDENGLIDITNLKEFTKEGVYIGS